VVQSQKCAGLAAGRSVRGGLAVAKVPALLGKYVFGVVHTEVRPWFTVNTGITVGRIFCLVCS